MICWSAALVTVGLAVIFALIGFLRGGHQDAVAELQPDQSNQLHEYFTVNSVFFDPDIFGRYLALVMILLPTVLLYDRRARASDRIDSDARGAVGMPFFTLSRSSLAALSLGMAVLAGLRWRASRCSIWQRL